MKEIFYYITELYTLVIWDCTSGPHKSLTLKFDEIYIEYCCFVHQYLY